MNTASMENRKELKVS